MEGNKKVSVPNISRSLGSGILVNENIKLTVCDKVNIVWQAFSGPVVHLIDLICKTG